MFNILSIAEEELVEFLLVLIIVLLALYFATMFIQAIGKVFLFRKAGKSWIPAFIPILDNYTLCSISGTNLSWLFLLYGSLVVGFFEDDLLWIFGLSMFVFKIILSNGISKSFGKGFGTAILLFFFGPLAYLFLGIFGKYVGPIGCFDPVFGRFSFGNTKKDPNAYTYDIKSISDKITFSGEPVKNNIKYSFCPGCGFKLSDGDKYCPGCGREL